MSNPAPTLIALDVDGVLNHFSKSAKNTRRFKVDHWPISVREPVLHELKELLARPDVTGIWLTTWLEEPALLDELSGELDLDELVPLRAESPVIGRSDSGSKIFNPRLDSSNPKFLSEASPNWWKFQAWELLLKDYGPARAAWLDDYLGRAKGPGVSRYYPGERDAYLFMRTHETAGLLPDDLTRLKEWLDR